MFGKNRRCPHWMAWCVFLWGCASQQQSVVTPAEVVSEPLPKRQISSVMTQPVSSDDNTHLSDAQNTNGHHTSMIPAEVSVETKATHPSELIMRDDPKIDSAFETVTSMDLPDVVISSAKKMDDQSLSLNTVNGGSSIIQVTSSDAPGVFSVASNAQIACTSKSDDGYHLALIERDAANAGFRLKVLTTQNLDDLNSADVWNVKTRGFQPNPGSGCAFLDARTLVVEGTRLRDGKVPYHGIFTVTPHKLELWPDFGIHVPHIVAAHKMHTTHLVMLRGVVVDENGKNDNRDRLYAIKTNAGEAVTGVLRQTAKNMTWVGENVIELQNEGVCFLKNEQKYCIDENEVVESVRWLPPASAVVRLVSGKQWLIERIDENPLKHDLGRHDAVLADLGNGYYLVSTCSDLRQDVGSDLRIAKMRQSP